MIILACATERECRSATALLDPHPEAWPNLISVAGFDILACIVGIGPVGAALSIGTLLERFPQTTGIVNLGICGSFDMANFPMGCPCVADAEIWPEYGVHTSQPGPEEMFNHQMLPSVSLFPANHLDLAPDAAARAMRLALPDSWPIGRSITVAGVSGDEDRATFLHSRYNAATENMEGFALALAARRHQLPFLQIRTVSNPVGTRDKTKWSFPAALGALPSILPALLRIPT